MSFDTHKFKEDMQQTLRVAGLRLRSLRLLRREAVDDVAFRLDISAQLLERIEKGLYDMEVTLFVRICTYYGVAPSRVIPS